MREVLSGDRWKQSTPPAFPFRVLYSFQPKPQAPRQIDENSPVIKEGDLVFEIPRWQVQDCFLPNQRLVGFVVDNLTNCIHT